MTLTESHKGIYAIITSEPADSAPQILVVFKARGPYQGLFDLPGGTPEVGENPKETLVREVKEETGLDVKSCSHLTNATFRVQYRVKEQQIVLTHKASFFFVDEISSRDAFDDDQVREDVAGFRWLLVSDLLPESSSPLVQWASKILAQGLSENIESDFCWQLGGRISRKESGT